MDEIKYEITSLNSFSKEEFQKDKKIYEKNVLQLLQFEKEFGDEEQKVKSEYKSFAKKVKETKKAIDTRKKEIAKLVSESILQEIKMGLDNVKVPVDAKTMFSNITIKKSKEFIYNMDLIPDSVVYEGQVISIVNEVYVKEPKKALIKKLYNSGVKIPGVTYDDKYGIAKKRGK